MNATHEEWRPVVGFEGSYEVSDLGRVRSVTRVVINIDGVVQTFHGKMLKPWSAKCGGYRTVSMRRDRRTYRALVNNLVLEAFDTARPNGTVCRHLDGNPQNNRLDNLAWGTQSENLHDAVRHGTHGMASKTHCINGHPFDAVNTRIYVRRNGKTQRVCRTCHRNEYWRRAHGRRKR